MRKDTPEISDIPEILGQGRRSSDSMQEAAASRNFSLFSRFFKKGSDSLNSLLLLIGKKGKECVSEYRDEIDSLLEKWKSCSELLSPWMNEIKEKIKKQHKTNMNDKKILNAYNFLKKSGNNLRVKAK